MNAKQETEPPDTQLAALDVLRMWERGELQDLTPDTLLQLQAVQTLTIALGRTTGLRATA